MSVENFKKFGQICVDDEHVRERVKQIGLDNISGWMEYSKNELNLEWSREDMRSLVAELGPEDELSEEQLAQVAGGVVDSMSFVIAGVVSASTAVSDSIRRGW